MKVRGARILRCLGAAVFFALLFSLLAELSLSATELSSRTLDSGWQFRAVANAAAGANASAPGTSTSGNTDHSNTLQWHPASVPGVVQTDLLQNGLIPDPFDRDNEYRLQWIGLTDWEYQTVFQADAATLAHEHLDLVFDGLDTFADVYLNDQAILHSDNMFRHWRISAKPLLKPGPNTLRIVFHSAIEKMIPYVKSLPYTLPSISTHNAGNEEDVATAPYTRKAPYHYGWDWGPRFMTEGIWQPVRLESWDALRIDDFHIHQQKIKKNAAWATAELDIEAIQATTATLALAHDPMPAQETNERPTSREATSRQGTSGGTQTLQLDAGMN